METTQNIGELPTSVTIKSRKRLGEYTGVSSVIDAKGNLYYAASISSDTFPSLHRSPQAAARAVDIRLIKQGKSPVNILKPVGRREVQ